MDLSMNKLSGEIPAGIGYLDKLTVLALLGNKLTGTIPVEIGNMRSLNILHLGRNLLEGNYLPSWDGFQNWRYWMSEGIS